MFDQKEMPCKQWSIIQESLVVALGLISMTWLARTLVASCMISKPSLANRLTGVRLVLQTS